MRFRGQPRWPLMGKCEERRLTAFFSRLPEVAPEIAIRPLEGEPFEIDYREPAPDEVPLEIGADGFYADYGAASRRFREATRVRVTRRVRVRGMSCLEVVSTGGAQDSGWFTIIWHGPGYYQIGRGHAYHLCLLDPNQTTKSAFPRRLRPDDTLRWTDAETVNGPEAHEPYFAGYYVVAVGGRDYECMRVIWPSLGNDDRTYWRLDETFISGQGRTVLSRRYALPEHVFRDYLPAPEGVEDDRSLGEAKLTYNGAAFQHWFDVLTDVSLGPLMKPRCRFGTPGYFARRAGALRAGPGAQECRDLMTSRPPLALGEPDG